MLTVLNVAYPLAAVGPASVGGAEQVLAALDRALVTAGHRSLVIAPAGSTVEGSLVPIGPVPERIDEIARGAAHAACRRAIALACSRWPVDLVHLHGIDCGAYLPPRGLPVLLTLHLPLAWYPLELLHTARPDTYFQCVSPSQRRLGPPGLRLLPDIANGVPVEELRARHAKRRFAMALGRICPEKGYHLALDAAREAGLPLLLAGTTYGYAEHEAYLREEVLPRLDAQRRLIGPVGFVRKRRLLSAARCLLVSSLVAETASLVAMEALACGTPVIAFRTGALVDLIEDGRTGFLVDTVEEMARAMVASGDLDPEDCRAAARERCDLSVTTRRYLELYARLAEPSGVGAVA
jgi:glycosyltransferase involved in cell wall biosynthesis